MGDYQRFALVLDSEEAQLGRAAMRLLELGIDVLYANDVDEAALLVRQESERLGALLVPAALGPARLGELLDRVCPQLAAGARALVPVGAAPDAEVAKMLLARGVEWQLWGPHDEREMRFVVGAAMATAHEQERRKHVRIPTRIETAVFMGRHRKDVVVHDLSKGGAYLAAENPFLAGSPLSIDISLPEGAVVGKAEVVNNRFSDGTGRADVPEGMGIEFRRIGSASEEALHGYVEGWIGRFRLARTEEGSSAC